MSYRLIYLFIEGPDDERFFENLFKNRENNFLEGCTIFYWPYSKKSEEEVNKHIKSINAMKNSGINADYIFVADLDEKYNSVEKKKKEKKKEYKQLDLNKIIVVKKEIESWYISGVDGNCPKCLKKIKIPKNTEKISKENLSDMTPKCFKGSRINFLLELIKCFNVKIAQKRNNSFDFFIKYIKEF